MKAPELIYELKIRNLEPSGTVEVKRKILRGVLSQENANRSMSEPSVHPYTHTVDHQETVTSLDDLTTIIDTFSGSKSDAAFKRISSRLKHLSGRISKIRTDNEVEEQAKRELFYRLLELEADLDLKVSSSTSTPTHTSYPTPVTSTRCTVAPYKWNVFFSGSDSTESVNSFLEKIESLRISRGVTQEELFHSAGDLFKGPAWTWYLNNRARVDNWHELVEKLRADFLPYFYDDDLEREIQSRTQGPNERVSLFISAMEGLFNRLTVKPSEEVIVNRIRRNLLPFFIANLALHNPTTISELSELCKKLEESRVWSERYKPPPRYEKGLLEPDLSCALEFSRRMTSTFPYNPPSASTSSTSSYSRNPKKFESFSCQTPVYRPKRANVSSVHAIQCWNCNDTDHPHRFCLKPRTKFCFKCGRKNVVTAQCPRCTKNESDGARGLDLVTKQTPDLPSRLEARKRCKFQPP